MKLEILLALTATSLAAGTMLRMAAQVAAWCGHLWRHVEIIEQLVRWRLGVRTAEQLDEWRNKTAEYLQNRVPGEDILSPALRMSGRPLEEQGMDYILWARTARQFISACSIRRRVFSRRHVHLRA